MSDPPFRAGDFVWCAFPQHEDPVRPGPLHLAYILVVNGTVRPGKHPALSALVAYTTSQPWPYPSYPLGVHGFDRQAAKDVGQARAFVLDLRRLAFLPVALDWFPRLDQPGAGVEGRLPKRQQRAFWRDAEELLTRRSDAIERLGPLWPAGRR